MKRSFGLVGLAAVLCLAQACKGPDAGRPDGRDLPHQLIQRLTDIIVVDIFTPPVASRIYSNCSIALYEAIRHRDSSAPSMSSRLKGFGSMPVPDPGLSYDFSLAAIQSFCEVAKKVTFSAPEITVYQDSMVRVYSAGLDKSLVDRSLAFGNAVSAVVAERLASDNYKQTRTMERFEVRTDDSTRWVPTAPDYADGLEPHWPKMLTMGLDSANQVSALTFAAYSEDTASPFHREMREVYDISRSRTDEQVDIALFWDDNPFVSQHKGHVMFQDKKMTPGGHWMAITQTACRKKGLDAVASAKAYVWTSVALYDAFIACWDTKYRTVRIRPQTAIQRLIDEQWISFIQTPPFPEYTSGHSTTSAAAAEMLTAIFGDGFAYTDSTELPYNLPVRSFPSFREAAKEASISRVYGGIHFRSGCENGNEQGRRVAEVLLKKLR
jgi:hypothetical protein